MSANATEARLAAMWWVVENPFYLTVARGPGHETEPIEHYELEVYASTDNGMGDSQALFVGDTRDEVLDQLVAWRIEQRLA